MKDKLTGIIGLVKSALRDAGGRSVGVLPEDIQFVGNNSPIILIDLVSDTVSDESGGVFDMRVMMRAYVITMDGIDKRKTNNKLLYSAYGKIREIKGTCGVIMGDITFPDSIPYYVMRQGDKNIISCIEFYIDYKNERII